MAFFHYIILRDHLSKNELQFAFFDTEIGKCAVTWTKQGIKCLQLPERNLKETFKRLAARQKQAVLVEASPPKAVRQAISMLQHHLQGKPRDLSNIHLDFSGVPPFH